MQQASRAQLTRRLLLGSAAGAAVLGAGAYVLRGPSDAQARRVVADANTLNRGNGAEPDTLDPHRATGTWENNIIGDMFMGLMTEDASGNPVPGAAESYAVSQDGLTYTFQLRDHKWSDGKPVTAYDYVYSFRRILDPKTASQYAPILYPLKNALAVNGGKLKPAQVGARAIGPRVLELSFEYQVPYIEQLLTHYATFAVPRHVVEKFGDDWTHPGNLVSNGAYVLTEWVANDHITLVKNKHFYDHSSVAIETVNFYPTQDSSAALKRLRAGEFDVLTDSIPPQQVDWLRANMPKELRLWPYILTQYVQFNTKRHPFDDVRVRKAVSLAIDREVIASKITRAGESPAYAFVPPGMPGYAGTSKVPFKDKSFKARQDEARALLAAAGHGPNSPLSFEYNIQNTTEAKMVAVALQAMWKDVGIDVRLAPSESQIHYNTLRKRDFSAAWAGWVADFRDPRNYLFLFDSGSRDLNFGDYANPKFDVLMSQSDHQQDAAARFALLAQAEQVLLDDIAIAPVYYGVTRDLVSPQVQGWISNNINVNRSRYLSLDRARSV